MYEGYDNNKTHNKCNEFVTPETLSENKTNSFGNLTDLNEPSQLIHQQLKCYLEDLQIMGNDLVQERRYSKELQDKIVKIQQRNIILKKKYMHYKQQLASYLDFFQILSDNVNENSLSINPSKQQLKINYKTPEFVSKFQQFINATHKTLLQHLNNKRLLEQKARQTDSVLFQSINSQSSCLFNSTKYTPSQKMNSKKLTIDTDNLNFNPIIITSPTNSEANGHIFSRIKDFISQKETEKQNSSMKKQLEGKIMEINNLKKLLQKKDDQINEANMRINQLNQQIIFVQNRNGGMFQQIQENQKIIRELKEEEEKKHGLLKTKEETIARYQKMLKNQKAEMEEKKKLQSNLLNYQRIIEENKEEISNLGQVIEKYKQQYGSLKNTKNKGIELQIKDYLRQLQQIEQFDDEKYENTTSFVQ